MCLKIYYWVKEDLNKQLVLSTFVYSWNAALKIFCSDINMAIMLRCSSVQRQCVLYTACVWNIFLVKNFHKGYWQLRYIGSAAGRANYKIFTFKINFVLLGAPLHSITRWIANTTFMIPLEHFKQENWFLHFWLRCGDRLLLQTLFIHEMHPRS